MKIKPYRKKPDIKQKFSSGNCVEVYIVEVAPKVFDAACEWDNFPPTPRDVAEYQKLVQPRFESAMKRLQAQRN